MPPILSPHGTAGQASSGTRASRGATIAYDCAVTGGWTAELTMAGRCMMRFAVMGVMLIAFGSVLRMVSAQETEVPREAVVGWLGHQERLVRSGECRYKGTWGPTRTEMIPL